MRLQIIINPRYCRLPRLSVLGLEFSLSVDFTDVSIYSDTRQEDIIYMELPNDLKRLVFGLRACDLFGDIIVTRNGVFVGVIDSSSDEGLATAIAMLANILRSCFYPVRVDIYIVDISRS